MEQQGSPAALEGIRVLDLTSPLGNYAAKLMADFGADVIKVEPIYGDAFRAQGPMPEQAAYRDAGLPFILNNMNKRSLTLDLESAAGQMLFRRLAKQADVVLETADPGWMDSRGIGYSALSVLNPGLVYTAITPFGQTGPHAGYRASDLTIQAMGGALALTGDPGERPVAGGIRVAEKMAGYTAATATAFAVHYRLATGKGQFIDVSAQEAVISQMEMSTTRYIFTGAIQQRNGWRVAVVTCPAGIYPCSDGDVSIVASKIHQWSALRDWIGDERLMKEEYLMEPARFADRDFIDPIVIEWTKTMKKADVFHGGQRRGIPIGECLRPGELVRDIHMLNRGYVATMDDPRIGVTKVPGAPYQMSGTPWRIRRPAPFAGQHNAEILKEIGVGESEVTALQESGVIG
jgi:benzylsuccinate CoA-transferase BbsE subunit